MIKTSLENTKKHTRLENEPFTSVQVSRQTERLTIMDQGDYNPHPVFPQWQKMDIYPYYCWGSAWRKPEEKNYTMVYLENDYLKIGCCVELGGRLWTMVDKLTGRHVINHASEVWSNNSGFGKNYTCGGMEINYPVAHSPTTRLPREYQTVKHADGSASIIIGELERKWGTRWSYAFTLRPDQARVEMTVRIYNRSPIESRYMYWCNCGIPLSPTTQFIFPERAGAMHGAENTTFSWPTWRGIDNKFPLTSPEMLGLYMLEAQDGYFGYYDETEQAGMVHYADLADLPGKKTWTWGARRCSDGHPCQHHPDNQTYGEIQSGRWVIQEHLGRLAPESEAVWTEYWYPVRKTGSFNGAGAEAVICAKIEKATEHSTELSVTVQGTRKINGVELQVQVSGQNPVKKRISIEPEDSTECKVLLPYKTEPEKDILVKVRHSDGAVLGTARISSPEKRDSWLEIASTPVRTQPIGIEEIYLEAEALARDWYYHDARSKYEECLKIDPGYSRALGRIGIIDLERGIYVSAIDYLQRALQRDPDNLEWRYYLGVTYQQSGELELAKHHLELACRDDFEPRSRIRLAEIRMQLGEFHAVLSHLNRVKDMAGRLTRPRGLLAAAYRHLGQIPEAKREIQDALVIDPMDPFLKIENMLTHSSTKEVEDLLNQVNGHEPPILEAAFDYGSAGLYSDAISVINLLPNPGPLALFYLAWLEEQTGQGDRAQKAMKKACSLDPMGHAPWRVEFIKVFRWAIAQYPKEPRSYHFLGNLFVARHREKEGLELWNKAMELGESSYLLYSSMANYELKVLHNKKKALALFQQAEQHDSADPYIQIEQAILLNDDKQYDQAIRYIMARPTLLRKSPPFAAQLAEVWVATKQYDQFDQFFRDCDFKFNWQLYGPHQVWERRYLQEAMECFEKDQYESANALLDKVDCLPENLVLLSRDLPVTKSARTLFHQGRCYEKLSRMDQAKECWLQGVSVEYPTAWEPAYWFESWYNRYFQALCFLKLRNTAQAILILDGIEMVARNALRLPYSGRMQLMELAARARLKPEDLWDPIEEKVVKVETSVEI